MMRKLIELKSMLLISVLSLLIFSCDSNKTTIKKDLESRYTNFEIVEIRKDSANVHQAINVLRSLGIGVSQSNLEIVKALNGVDVGNRTPYQNYLYIDSVYIDIKERLQKFENSKYEKPDLCFYIKYRIPKDEIKITKEEYYYINTLNGDVIHRPYDWDEFLYEQKYNELVDKAIEHTGEIIELKMKFL